MLQRLWHILTDPIPEPRYGYLESGERDAIRQILTSSLRNLPVTRIDGPDARFQTDVELASLAPGEYFFELAASSAAGEAKDLIGFRVTN